ncbi:response regulator [Methylocella sp. CPCC 101449]|uniref:response regulator n=1 Tax=Methylocella sp. CPCC 101449 TaxID=2987531 RepID=UPI003908BA7E
MTAMQQLLRNIVLVVDDSPQTVAMLAEVLESTGATALVALRGEKAIAIARQVTPDVILLDAIMPGMDGFETCRRIKRDEALSHVPVIFMTGLTDTDHIVRGLEAGGVDYIAKPIDPKELLARIHVHLVNARIARSAQNALDTAGHHLMAMDDTGRLLWWTPQAGRLIAALLADGLVVGAMLPEPLHALVAKGAEPITEVTIASPHQPLEVRVGLLGKSGSNEYLLRLVEEVTGSVERILSERLQISLREAQVLLWLAQGKSNRDIAEILNLSPRTVNKHLERMFKKMGVENRTSAAAIALKFVN